MPYETTGVGSDPSAVLTSREGLVRCGGGEGKLSNFTSINGYLLSFESVIVAKRDRRDGSLIGEGFDRQAGATANIYDVAVLRNVCRSSHPTISADAVGPDDRVLVRSTMTPLPLI